MNTILDILVTYLSDKNKLNLLSTCKEFWQTRKEVRFTGHCRYDRWMQLGMNIANVYVKCRGIIPQGATHVYLHKNFNEPIVIPEGVICIQFGKCFNQRITLPNSVRIARFGKCFNQPLILPKGLRNLQLGNDFNQPIMLHDGIEVAVFGKQFNQPTIFPESLRHLEFGKWFNHPITGALPNLQWLRFGDRFNSELNLVDMDSLKHLEFGMYFNQPIDFLPDLEYLSFECYFRQHITLLPSTLKYLKITTYGPNPLVLPDGLEYLIFIIAPDTFPVLPKSLKYLDIGYNAGYTLHPGYLPEGIVHLKLGNVTNRSLAGCLPKSLKYLDAGRFNSLLLPGDLPEGLEELYMPKFNWSLHPGVFPDSIKKLVFGRFNRLLKNLPKYLEYLDLGRFYDMPFSGHDLPTTLKFINFGERFNQNIDYLPSGMDRINFCFGFSCPLPENFTVKYLTLPRGYPHITDSLRKRATNISDKVFTLWMTFPSINAHIGDEPTLN